MEKNYKRVPFDIELVKKIQLGEVEGRIVTVGGQIIDTLLFTPRSLTFYKIACEIDGKLHTFTSSGHEREWDNSGKWRNDLIIELPEKAQKHEFKPFDKVLVRDYNGDTWCVGVYSHPAGNGDHYCIGGRWHQVITFGGNEHLLGTTNNPEE